MPARSVAIVDDDRPVLKSVSRLLRIHGFDARTYESAPEFLATGRRLLPDCLIVDFQMVEMTGLDLLEYLRTHEDNVPVIIITAYGSVQVTERCLAAGAVACLSKPLQPSTLLAAIDVACNRGGEGLPG